MKRKLLFLAMLFVFSAAGLAQQNYWKKITVKSDSEIRQNNVRISEYALFSLNTDEIISQLKNAPDRTKYPSVKGILLNFPNSEEGFDVYEVYEASTMHPDLQSRYSDIRSYLGFKKGDKSSIIRFTLDPFFGFNAMMRNDNGIFYIDSHTTDNQVYKMYDRKKASSLSQFQCLVEDESEFKHSEPTSAKTVVDGLNRKYRLAITTTIEYTAYIAQQAGVGTGTDAQKKAAVLAAVNLVVNRLNEVFEKDVSVSYQLIANADALFFVNTDTFTPTNAGQMINENQTVTNNIIGVNNYDIGHLFFKVDLAANNNGLAQTPAICLDGKARGVTGNTAPVGDPFVIDYVAHEMGHQFGANHVQNNGCNRNTPTSVEPGSASSIMGYAGICAPNVQNNSDPYFNAISVNEMYQRLIAGATSNCGNKLAINNTEPSANAGPDKTIPRSTPFVLTGTATDPNNDALAYSWEQQDIGAATMPPQPTNATGPLFRSINPSTSPMRYFPELPKIVNPNLASTWEVLPSIARTLNFSLLVRDNNPLGGQTGRDDIRLTVSAAAGPFIVTSQNAPGIVWTQGQSQIITWDVANTTAAPVSTSNVTILLSKDGGLTFPTVLVASTPNDGSHAFDVPSGLGNITNARIMVKAVDNVFLNVNSHNFTVNSSQVVDPPPVTAPERIREGLLIYPVPSNDGYVYIKADFEPFTPRRPYEVTYEIYAMDGKLIVPKKTRYIFEQHLEKIDLRDVPTEAYMIHVTIDGEKIVKKLLMLHK